MKISQIMWLAGYLEGEGCFRIPGVGRVKRRPASAGTPSVKVAATDRDVVERAAALMGTDAHDANRRTTSGKPVYTAEVCGRRALRVMRLILPHMGARRSLRINEVISLAAKRLGRPARGTEKPNSKFSDAQVVEVRALARRGAKQIDLACRFGVSQAAISLLVTRQTYKHVGA